MLCLSCLKLGGSFPSHPSSKSMLSHNDTVARERQPTEHERRKIIPVYLRYAVFGWPNIHYFKICFWILISQSRQIGLDRSQKKCVLYREWQTWSCNTQCWDWRQNYNSPGSRMPLTIQPTENSGQYRLVSRCYLVDVMLGGACTWAEDEADEIVLV